MRTATGLSLITAGAILTFAVTVHTPFLNVQVAGVVLMLAGVAGLAIPRRGYGWLRRRMVTRRGPRGPVTRVEETRYPPYVMLNPGANPRETYVAPNQPGGTSADTMVQSVPVDSVGPAAPPRQEETVEEYIEE